MALYHWNYDATPAPFTAPDDGWIYIYAAGDAGSYVTLAINGVQIYRFFNGVDYFSTQDSMWVPIKKGDVLSCIGWNGAREGMDFYAQFYLCQ